MSEHLSRYAIDCAYLGEVLSPALTQHLRGCARCAAALDGLRVPVPHPAWLVRLDARRRRPRRSPAIAWLAAPVVLGAAAAVALLVQPGGLVTEQYLREKGGPKVTVYVKRGAEVSAWDRRSPVRPNDRIRIGVRAGAYAHVSVASLAPSGPQVLYAGPLGEPGEVLLPLSFRVDDAAGDESLSIVLSKRPVEPLAHLSATASGGAWTQQIRIPKENLR